MAEAEYMMMTNEAYKKLGLDIEIEFNNRKLLTGIIISVLGNISEEKIRKCIMLIDKFAKMTREELVEEFNKLDISSEQFDELMSYFSLDYASLKEKLADSDSVIIEEGLAEIAELYQYLEGTEALTRMKFTPYLARGIDVYTGTVWEVFLKDRKIAGQDFNISIGGGGRFDKIITTFVDDGTEYPAVGMSFGLDVIYEILVLKNAGKKTPTVDVFVIPFGTNFESFKFASALRDAGLRVEVDKNTKKLKKSLAYANKMNIPYVIILGEDELKKGFILVKTMESGTNTEFPIDDYEAIKRFIIE